MMSDLDGRLCKTHDCPWAECRIRFRYLQGECELVRFPDELQRKRIWNERGGFYEWVYERPWPEERNR